MPAIAALTINDGQTTPVARTFSPVSTNGAKGEFADRSASIPAGFATISHEVRRPANASSAQRIVIGMNVPKVETVNGVATVTRFSSAKVELNLSNLSTEQERKDLLAFVRNYLAQASVATSVTNIEPFY